EKLPAVIGPNLGTGAGAVHPVHRLTEHRHGTAGDEVPDPLTAGGLLVHDDHGLRRAIVKALHVAPAVSLCPVLQLHDRARNRVPDLSELGGVTTERERVRDLLIKAHLRRLPSCCYFDFQSGRSPTLILGDPIAHLPSVETDNADVILGRRI